MKAVFLCPPSRAFGEINTLMSLARDVAGAGGSVWFLASPHAAAVARAEFPAQTFEMTDSRERNHAVLLRILRKFRPDLLVFPEFYEIIRPGRRPDCPLVDSALIEALDDFDCTLVFIDFIAHAPILREIGECETCADRFGGSSLRRFFRRLFVMVPCPLNDPDMQDGSSGIPYRSLNLPRRVSPAARDRLRARFLVGERGYLVLRTGSTWQSKLAEKQGVGLYRHLGALLGYYFGGLPRPVTLVSVSSAHQLEPPDDIPGFHICNVSNLPPQEFEQLVLAADLVLIDNEIASTLGTTIGRVPGVVLINSQDGDTLLNSLEEGPVRRVVAELEHERPGSVYPHKVFPIRAGRSMFADSWEEGNSERSRFTRLGRMPSSPFSRAEIYGGEGTRRQLRRLLCDTRCRRLLKRQDAEYIARLSALEDGVSVLARLVQHRKLAHHCVL